MAAVEKIWLYLWNTREFKQISRDDPRLDWNFPYAPSGKVKFQVYKKRWEYVEWGTTIQETTDKANRLAFETIRKLEAEIAAIKARLVTPE